MVLAYFCSEIWRGKLTRRFSKHFSYLTSLVVLSGLVILGGVAARTLRTRSLPSPKAVSNAGNQSSGKLWQQYGSLPLSFESNEGQVGDQVKFLSRGRGYSLLLTETEAVLQLPKRNPQGAANSPSGHASSRSRATADRESVNVGMKLLEANLQPEMRGTNPLPGKNNYFLGNDPQKWKTGVPQYSKVHYQNVYPGIDLVYYGNQRKLEYDYIVAPGADPEAITVEFRGIESLKIDGGGDLVISSEAGELRLHKPHAYQVVNETPQTIASSFEIKGDHRVGFQLDSFDASLPLTIDPVLTYSTYLGGSEDDSGLGIAVDTEGAAYVTGVTYSANFPHSNTGASFAGEEAFVTKLNPAGDALVYSTYFGGNGAEAGKHLVVDSSGNVYVYGGTRSSNFPVTLGAVQTTLRGGGDAFVVKLNPAGNQFLYATYLGGNGEEGWEGGGIGVDTSGNACVTGTTDSLDFPTTRTAFQRSYGGGTSDAFVVRLNEQGTNLIYSTYLGGNDLDQGQGIAVDSAGRAYVTGRTRSPDFVLFNAFQPVRRSLSDDAFVTKLNSSGDLVTYSTFLGGSANDAGHAIAIDSAGNAYVAGETASIDFPTTVGAVKAAHEGYDSDGFVAKIRTTSSRSESLAYSTYLGGSSSDVIRDIALTDSGTVYVTGVTDSGDFPTVNAVQANFGGGATDAFITKLNSLGASLVYSTYLGGSGDDSGEAIAAAPASSAIVAGTTESGNFPVAGAFQGQRAGKKDAFVSRLPAGDGSPAVPIVSAGIILDPTTTPHQVAETLTARFTIKNQGGSILPIKTLTLAETDPENAVPDFLPLRNLTLDPGDSVSFFRSLVLTQTGTFAFQVRYQSTDGVWHDVGAEEGASSQVTITVENTNNTTSPTNTISASTNPCNVAFGGSTCSTTLTWSTVNVEAADVMVEDISAGTPPSLFASGPSGESTAAWIRALPHRYKFTLYDVSSGTRQELTSLEVTGEESNPANLATLSVSNNPCIIPAGGSVCSTTITWNTSAEIVDSVQDAVLYVQDAGVGGPSSGVQGGVSGSVDVAWIQGAPHRYVFTLFLVTSSGQFPVTSVEVTGHEENKPAIVSGTISASPNPCVIASGATTCTTTVTWNTADYVEDARVAITDIGSSGTPVRYASGKSGSVAATIEAAPHKYRFTLYQIAPSRVIEIASVDVSP